MRTACVQMAEEKGRCGSPGTGVASTCVQPGNRTGALGKRSISCHMDGDAATLRSSEGLEGHPDEMRRNCHYGHSSVRELHLGSARNLAV